MSSEILVQESDSYARRSEADWTSRRANSPMNRSRKSNRCLDHSDHVLGSEDIVETGTGFRVPVPDADWVRDHGPSPCRLSFAGRLHVCPQTGDGGIKLTQLGA